MATEGFINRFPPPTSGVPHSQPSSSATAPSVQQESGSVPTTQQPLFNRPVFYMQAPPPPPPPPLLQYQWPMPYYHPFMGFPGSGYGMVMPPFLPPSYLEPSAYILPHLQPVDYRRLHHPSVNVPVPTQQPQHQPHRPRPPVRETVSTEVQTDPTQRREGGFDDARSDSGHGTASNTSSPLSSSSKKGGSEEVKGCTPQCRNTESSQLPEKGLSHPVKSLINTAQSTQQCRKAVGQELPLVLAHYNIWPECSPDGILPVLNSSRKGVKERRLSVPDILMLKNPDKVPPQNPPSLYNTGTEAEMSVFQHLETKCDSVLEEIAKTQDEEMLFKILRLNSSGMFRREAQDFSCNPDETLLSRDESHEPETDTTMNDTAELRRQHVTSLRRQSSRKLNESVWSVESLEPYVMSRDWLLQNDFLEQQVIVEAEGAEMEADFHAKSYGETPRGYQAYSSDLVTTSCMDFSTPAEKYYSPKKTQNGGESEGGIVSGKDAQEEEDGLIPLQDKTSSTPTEGDIHEKGSPEATQSQNHQDKSLKTLPLVSDNKTPKGSCIQQRAADTKENPAVLPLEVQGQPNAPMKTNNGTESLKSLDRAVQCTDLCECTQRENCNRRKGMLHCSGRKKAFEAMPEEGFIQERYQRNGRKCRTETYRNRNKGGNGRKGY